MEPIEQQLTELVAEQKQFIAKTNEELKANGTVTQETAEAVTKLREKLDEAQKQIDAVDLKLSKSRFAGIGGDEVKSMGQEFVESDEFKAFRANQFLELRSKDGRFRKAMPELFAGYKSTITTTAGITQGTTGVTMPERLAGITGMAQQALRIRSLFRTPRKMTQGNSFDFVRQNVRTNAASPQVETSPKAESTYGWESASSGIKTIAHWTNVSRQALDDVPWLQGVLDSELRYGLLLKEESEILAGDGLGSHLYGIIPQATAYAGTYAVSADTYLDKLRHAKLEARMAGLATFAPDGIVLNPVDMQKIELIKDETGGANTGRYIIGDPRTGPSVTLLWGLPVVESDSITVGKFLLGNFQDAAELVDRMEAMIELSYENGTNFVNNVVTVLAEERLGLAVRRPTAFVYGSF